MHRKGYQEVSITLREYESKDVSLDMLETGGLQL
jgi:hypothetical protein